MIYIDTGSNIYAHWLRESSVEELDWLVEAFLGGWVQEGFSLEEEGRPIQEARGLDVPQPMKCWDTSFYFVLYFFWLSFFEKCFQVFCYILQIHFCRENKADSRGMDYNYLTQLQKLFEVSIEVLYFYPRWNKLLCYLSFGKLISN